MSVQLESGRNGHRRSMNGELNLVPMIDLLIVSISFLLITAVWTQLSRLEVAQQGPGVGSGSTPWMLKIKPEGFEVATDEVTRIPRVGREYDYDRLEAEFARLRSLHPEREQFLVVPEDGVKYDDIVHAMDLAVRQRFVRLSIATSSAS